MICSYKIITLSKSAWVELVSLKDDCSWRIEIITVVKEIDSPFVLKEEQRTAINAFVDRKDVFAVLPTGFGKSLYYQLALMVTNGSFPLRGMVRYGSGRVRHDQACVSTANSTLT